MKQKKTKTNKKINESKAGSLIKVIKFINLARLIRKKKSEDIITRIRNERDNITTDSIDIRRIIREYYIMQIVQHYVIIIQQLR